MTLNDDWRSFLSNELNKKYFVNLTLFLEEEYKKHIIHPPKQLIFNALNCCPLEGVKVVIIGQDPYHGLGQAHGLSFSVNDGVKFPPSLRNIFKELKHDLNIDPPFSGNLENWAKQGVLLLNATLSVENKKPGSHQNKGWEQFTNTIIKKLSDKYKNLVFILWGAFAQQKLELIDLDKHYIIKSAHPSPFSAQKGFFGSKPFSKTNEYLASQNQKTINW